VSRYSEKTEVNSGDFEPLSVLVPLLEIQTHSFKKWLLILPRAGNQPSRELFWVAVILA
jgi:hypothetical protein